MNIREELLAGYSKAHTLKMATLATRSSSNFAALIECFISKETVLAQRAAWALTWAARKNPRMVLPHLETIVSCIEKPAVHDAVTRCALSILEFTDIPEELEGRVMNACFRFIEEPGHPPAWKAYSLTIAWNLAQRYPDIIHELQSLIESNWENESPAFRSRGRKILKSIASKTRVQ